MPETDSKDDDAVQIDDQLSVPCRSEDKQELRVEAARKGISMGELARRRIFGRREKVPA
jgi:hypothetical protein